MAVRQTRMLLLGAGLGILASVLVMVVVLRLPDDRHSGPIAVLRGQATEAGLEGLGYSLGSSLSTELTRNQLEVIPWMESSSYESGAEDPLAIAQELAAGYLLQSSISTLGDSVRVDAALTDASGSMRWSRTLVAPGMADPSFVECYLAREIVAGLCGFLKEDGREYPPHPDPRRLFDLAVRAMERDDERAEDLLREALCLDPGYTDAYVALATMYYRRPGSERMDEAIRNYRTALDLDPGLVAARRGLVNSFWAFGRFEDGLRQVVGIPAEVAELDRLLLRGEAYCKCGLPDRAIPELERVLELDPENEAALWTLVYAELSTGRSRQAVDRGLDYLARFGPDPWVDCWVTWGYTAMGLPDSAVAAASRSLTTHSLEQSNLWNKITVAVVLQKHGKEAEATRILVQTRDSILAHLKTVPSDDTARSFLVPVYARLGEVEKAVDLAEEVMESPGSGMIAWGMACHLAAVEPDRALDILWQALKSGTNYYLAFSGPNLRVYGAAALAGHPGYQEFERACLADLERLRRTYR